MCRLGPVCFGRWLVPGLLLALTVLTPAAGPAWAQSIPPPVMPDEAKPCAPEPSNVEQAIWTSYYAGTEVWGYVDRHSVAPGQAFDLMLSTKPSAATRTVRAEVLRVGHEPTGDRALVWRSPPVTVRCQEVSSTAAAIGPGWSPTIPAIPTAGWRSGYYTIDVVHEGTGVRELDVAYIVVTDPRRSGDILVKLGTNTYEAYNDWGGASLYGSALYGLRGQIVAFDRPTAPSFVEYDRFFVGWIEALAERNGWSVAYATNFDLHADPGNMDDYRLVIVPGHDEYWSKEEFDAFERRIYTRGQNTLFLGGNIAYWQVRYVDLNNVPGRPSFGRQMVCYKQLGDPVRRRVGEGEADLLVTARFRDGLRRPETALTGIGTQGWFQPRSDRDPAYPLYVARTDLPFFVGTGLQAGDVVGDVAGYEWDNIDPVGDGARLWDPARSRIAELDGARLSVVLEGAPRDDEGREGRAQSVYFVSPAGAKVFSAGAIRWAWGLGKPGFTNERFKALNENLVRYFLEPTR